MTDGPAKPGESKKGRGLTHGGKVLIAGMAIVALVVVGLFIHVIAFWSCWDCHNPQAMASLQAANDALVASYGGPPPADCGSSPVPVHERVARTIWDEEGNVYVGRSPVWLEISHLAIEGGWAVLHLEHSGIGKGPDGFQIYLTWVTNADFGDVIHVRLTDARSGIELTGEPAVSMHDRDLLAPSEARAISVGPTPPYRIFVTTVNVPASPGCYLASASWPGDSWSVTIAVGR
jgi:hypothetical protein